YYDMGHGLTEKDSAVQAVVAGHPCRLRFALPAGTLRSLRLDPIDRGTHMILSGARIVDDSGQVLETVAPEEFHSANQIESMAVKDSALLVTTEPEGNDPQISVTFPRPVDLPHGLWWKGIALVLAALLAALVLFHWACGSATVRLGERGRTLWAAAHACPGRAVLLTSLVATIAANYPVVFAGKSFVSPNLGTALLYGKNPWVPGFQSIERGNSNSADIDALMWHHLPLSMIQRRAVLGHGELPLWNRYDSSGTPLLGQGQSCFGDPLQLIPLLADGAAWAWDLKFLLAKGLLSCAMGFCLWRLTRHLPVVLLLTASVQFIGFFVFRVNHPAIFSLCYAPWIIYCWLRVIDCRSVRAAVGWLAALLAVNLVEISSGTVKEAYILLLYMNFTGLCLLLASPRPAREKARLLGGLCVEGLLFVVIGSPAWLTFYRALRNSYTTYQAAQTYQIQPGMAAGLFDEVFYRPFQIYSNVINPSANFFILIGLVWIGVRWRSFWGNRTAAALLASTLPAALLAFGAVSPGLVSRVPFLGNILHVDNTFSCALVLLFTLLAGLGWTEAWARLAVKEGRAEAAAVVVLIGLVLAAFLGTAQAVLRSAYAEETWGKVITVDRFIYLYGLSLIAGSALLLWVLQSARSRGSWTSAGFICAAAAFAALHWRHGLQISMAFPDYVIMPTGRVDLVAHSPAVDSILARRDSPYRAVGFGDNFFPGWTIAYDIEGISGPDALMNRYYRELMDSSGVERLWDWRYRVYPSQLALAKPVLDLLNVRFYLDYPAGQRPTGSLLKPFSSSDMEVYESPTSWPRAFFTDSVAVYQDLPQYTSWIRAGDGRPFAAIERKDWIRLNPLPRVSGDLGTRRVAPAADYVLTPNSTAFTVSAAAPGFIVLTEAYERDNFRATLNGADAPYLRVNHAFKGIYVDRPGTYRVKFSYWPRDLTQSLAAACGGLGLVVLALGGALLGRKASAGLAPLEI
ncbi:MAG TPA: hypothetical protein VII09_04775, partial [Opitutaceae bacterium]